MLRELLLFVKQPQHSTLSKYGMRFKPFKMAALGGEEGNGAEILAITAIDKKKEVSVKIKFPLMMNGTILPPSLITFSAPLPPTVVSHSNCRLATGTMLWLTVYTVIMQLLRVKQRLRRRETKVPLIHAHVRIGWTEH